MVVVEGGGVLGVAWVVVMGGRHWARVGVAAVVGVGRVARFVLLRVIPLRRRSHGGMVRPRVAVVGVGGVAGAAAVERVGAVVVVVSRGVVVQAVVAGAGGVAWAVGWMAGVAAPRVALVVAAPREGAAVGWMAGVAAPRVALVVAAPRAGAAMAVRGVGVAGVALVVAGCTWWQWEVRRGSNLDTLGLMAV